MNPDLLERGRAFNTSLRALSDAASSWVEDLEPDPWPGRRDQALQLHDQLQHQLQEARTTAGELTVVLSQDVAP